MSLRSAILLVVAVPVPGPRRHVGSRGGCDNRGGRDQCHELLLRGSRRIEKERLDVLSGCWMCSQFLARRTRKSFRRS
jgi:hypothetical protein